jgi:hypothetical protein
VNVRALLCLLIVAPTMAQTANVGLKITIRDSISGRQTMQETQYVQGDRRRDEHRFASGYNASPPLASITRCDMGQNFVLNIEDKQYASTPIPKILSPTEMRAIAAKRSVSATPSTPTILIEITTVDTGERKKLFGYEARHVITSEKHTHLNGAKEVEQEDVRDGWFADLPTSLSCYPRSRGAVAFATLRSINDPVEVSSLKLVGTPDAGFALSMMTTSHSTYRLPDGSNGQTTSISRREVTELFSGPLDPQLFEVPSGFTKVERLRSEPPLPLSIRAQEYWNSLMRRISHFFS